MKNNFRHYTYLFIVSMLMLTSCQEFLDINEDPNNPVDVAEPQLLGGVIANFSYEVLGGYPVRVTNTWVQQTAYNGTLPHYGIYDIDENAVNNLWTFFSYTDVMQNCKVLVEKSERNGTYDYAGIARTIWAWNMSIVTDLWNSAPYSQAWQQESYPFPVYDSQETIYENIQTLLDEAIDNFDRTDKMAPFVGAEDFVYGGDISKWRKMAHMLKARFYLHLTYAPGKDARTQAQLALDQLSDAFTSNADDAGYTYVDEEGQENPWFQYTIDGKWDNNTQLSAHYVDLLLGSGDPRIHAQAQLQGGVYAGHPNGAPSAANVSFLGNYYSDADAALDWLTFAEQKFIEAEAKFLLGDKTGAEAAYQEGVMASFAKLSAAISVGATKAGVTAAELDQAIDDYMAANLDLVDQDNAAYRQIMIQKYIANYLQFETYNDYRRTGFPILEMAQNVIQTDLNEVASRFPYPSAELNFNTDNVNAQGIPVGRRAVKEKVWWDSAPENCTLCPQ
ncbi:MAG: SusD/RagB family nutrient-binding outer membrane lipoprotein [Saprospiraceae bacterium]|nr:SusD/RagB family nutrient-binding outer membrane lipoprotein [Lewinella sp.]